MSQGLRGAVYGWGGAYLAAGIGGLASASAGSFYLELTRPGWAPPGNWFGPVWTLLYTLMGLSFWLVWRADSERAAKSPLVWHTVQLIVNSLWSWVFFVWRLGGPAFVHILVLLVLIGFTARAFARIRTPAAWLLLPYALWVMFAAVLNFSLWRLNPDLL